MLNPSQVAELAQYLDRGLLEAKELPRLTEKFPDLSLDDAYLIQDQGIAQRVARGEKLVGLKMGLTSQSKREQMGLHTPIYGVLTEEMQIHGGTFSLQGKIHPKIEPEIAFMIDRDLKGEVTLEEALAACSAVTSALEILDSRFVGFKYFSLPDVVADNSSSAYFVVNPKWYPLQGLKLDDLEMSMTVNGTIAQSARSSAISDHPGRSIVQLCSILNSRGRFLPKGSIVLAGAATQAVALEAGQTIGLKVDGLGEFTVSIRA